MELFYAHVGSLGAALEQTPEIFESVSMDLPVNVFFGVVNDLVRESLFLESLIGHERVGVDRAACFDVSANVSLQSVFFAIANYSAANFSTTFQNADDGYFVFSASLSNPALALIRMHEAGGTANESLIHFDFAPASAEFQNRAVLHRKTDAMKHEPRGLLSYTESAGNFVGTDSVLAVRDQPHSDQPLTEGQGRILKDGADFDGELALRMFVFTFPHTASRDEANIIPATSGAFDAIGPTPFDHEREAVVRIGEMHDGLLECSWLFHGVPHKTNRSRNALLSQVYYCPYKGSPSSGLSPIWVSFGLIVYHPATPVL